MEIDLLIDSVVDVKNASLDKLSSSESIHIEKPHSHEVRLIIGFKYDEKIEV